MYCVYVLKNKDSRIYIGQTANIDDRIVRHNTGRERSTRGYRPFMLIHLEKYASRSLAVKRERELKTGQGRLWIKNNFLK